METVQNSSKLSVVEKTKKLLILSAVSTLILFVVGLLLKVLHIGGFLWFFPIVFGFIALTFIIAMTLLLQLAMERKVIPALSFFALMILTGIAVVKVFHIGGF